jgi:hypothetical protein
MFDFPILRRYNLCHMNHISKIWYLFFIYLTLLHWKSNTILYYRLNGQILYSITGWMVKYYTLLQGEWSNTILYYRVNDQILYSITASMYYILHWQFEWKNMSLSFSIEMIRCLPRFIKFASTFSIKTICISEVCFWDKMTMLSYIVCHSFGFYLPTSWHKEEF